MIAADHEISGRTVAKWGARYRDEGEDRLIDRGSAPGSSAHRTPEGRVRAIAALRRLRMTAAEIAVCLGMARLTVSAVLRWIGLGKLGRLEPREPANGYERACPGELVYVDVKRRGVITGAGHRVTSKRTSQNATGVPAGAAHPRAGSSCTYASMTPLAWPCVEVLADEQGATAAGFLGRAIAIYASHAITVQRVISDNGACYRSTIHAVARRLLGLRHLRTRPYRPPTNAKAERFIRTLLAGSAHGAIYRSSRERTAAPDGWP